MVIKECLRSKLVKVKDIIGGDVSMVILLFIYAFVVAGATIFENNFDTISTKVLIYTSWWFIILHILMVVNFVLVSQRRRLFTQKKWGALMLHYGFVVILIGALITHITGTESILTVREGEKAGVSLSSTTYIHIEVGSGDSKESITEEVVYGDKVSSDFSYSFDVNDAPLEVNFLEYKKFPNGSAFINVEILRGDKREIVAIDGGEYKFMPKTLIVVDGIEVLLQYGSRPVELPFDIELIDFELKRYPGSSSPSSYSSDVNITYKGETTRQNIYMNNIAYIGSYRVYQTSYDPDEKGTILTVNEDMIGTAFSYIGYLMMAFGFVFSVFHKNSRFSLLKRRLKDISTVVVLMVALGGGELMAQSVDATSTNATSAISTDNTNSTFTNSTTTAKYISLIELSKTAPSKKVSDEFAKLMVQNPNGRVEPIGSYATKILLKLHRERSYHDMDANQVLIAITTHQYEWGHTPIIYIGNEQLLDELEVKDEYVSFAELFDASGNYVIEDKVDVVYSKAVQDRNKYEKELLKVDERVNILYRLFNGHMLPLFPIKGDANSRWLSMGDSLNLFSEKRDSLLAVKMIPWLATEIDKGDVESAQKVIGMIDIFQRAKADPDHIISDKKIKAELFYNSTPIFKRSAIAYLALGALLLIIMLTNLLRSKPLKRSGLFVAAISTLLVGFWLWHTFGIGLRWYISGRAPWTSSYESMIYVGWSALLMGIYFVRKSPVTLAISALMAGAIIMISQLNLLDPEITPLVPVLKSYWLMFHVATITASYGFFGVAALIGIAVMIIIASSPKGSHKSQIEELTIINEMAIIIGLILLSIGIFIGAVWANESWGRYWGWDPKESWALITMVIYALLAHIYLVPSLKGKFIFNMLSVYAFYTVLMTFFGVNYYLSGMHSYGNVDGIPLPVFLIPTFSLIVLTLLAYRKSD